MTIKLPKISGKTWAKVILGTLVALFMIHIGHTEGVKEVANKPPAAIMAQLDWAQNHSKGVCHAVWSTDDHKADTVAGWEVVCGSEGDAVKTFNDGFSDSKADDCQQGFDKACKWLATTRK